MNVHLHARVPRASTKCASNPRRFPQPSSPTVHKVSSHRIESPPFHAPQSLRSRFFSATPSTTHLDLTKQKLLAHLALPIEQKIKEIVHQAVRDQLAFNRQESSEDSLAANWERLRTAFPSSLPPISEAVLDDDAIVALFNLPRKFPPPIQSHPLINNVTEFYWASVLPTFPFTQTSADVRSSRFHEIFEQTSRPPNLPAPNDNALQNQIFQCSTEDSLAAILLATPHLNEKTLVQEDGCWSGETLFNLLYFTHLHGKKVAGSLGTDIHTSSLNIAETVSNLLGLQAPLIQFRHSNSLYPIDLQSLRVPHTKLVRLAMRVLPVLTPDDGRRFLTNARAALPSPDSLLILSYALPKGKTFELNQMRAHSPSARAQFREILFDGGCSYFTPFPAPQLLPNTLATSSETDFLINTYYTTLGFEKLVNQCDFQILQQASVGRYSDNDRNVVVLKPLI